VINKNLTQESIDATVKSALELGWKNIKLYFMLGLPFETQEDVAAIADMAKRLGSAHARGKKSINVSTTAFIPKAHTPFQRWGQISLPETQEKLQYLKDNLRHPKVKLKWQDPHMSRLEGVFARGDRRLSKLLVTAWELGCRLDGWADYLDISLWEKAFEKTAIDPEFYTTRTRDPQEPLPWDHIDSGVSGKFLAKEFERAQKLALTPDCRDQDCTGCGICDFKTLEPRIHPPAEGGGGISVHTGGGAQLPDEEFRKFIVHFTKLGEARFFGHLELATIVRRAVRRAGLTVKYSKGFNPSMRLSFENALPVGLESENERFFIYLDKTLSVKTIQVALNKAMPQGINIIRVALFSKKEGAAPALSRYIIRFDRPCLDRAAVSQFLDQDAFLVEDLSKKGKIRQTDLRQVTRTIHVQDDLTLIMELQDFQGRTIRPARILKEVFHLDETRILTARIVKTDQG